MTAVLTPKGERTRQVILSQALETAYRRGLGGLTIGDLAAGSGLSKSGLFAHFGSKEALQIAVLDEAAEQFAASVVRPALRAPRGEARVRALVDRWLGCGIRREAGGCVFVKAATELDEQDGPVRDRLAAHHRALADTIEAVVRSGISAGAFRPDTDPRQFANDLYGVMLAFYHAHRLLRAPGAEDRARTAVDALLAAAAPHQSHRSHQAHQAHQPEPAERRQPAAPNPTPTPTPTQPSTGTPS